MQKKPILAYILCGTRCSHEDGILARQRFGRIYLTRNPDRPDHPGRVAHHHSERRNVLGYNTTSPDSGSIADVHPWQDDDIASEPAVRPDMDWFAGLGSSSAISNTWIERVRSTEEGAIGTDQGTCSDRNFTSVDPSRVRVDIDVGSEPGMMVYD